MSMIEDIKRDREAGTQARWSVSGVRSNFKGKGHQIDAPSLAGVAWIGYEADQHNACVADARRIARVPDMEAALIAAEELADAAGALIALEDNTSPFGGELQADRIERTHDRFIASIAAYRAATGAA